MARAPDSAQNGNCAAIQRVLGLAPGNALSSLRERVYGSDRACSAKGHRQHRWRPDGSEPPVRKRRANHCTFNGPLARNDCEAFGRAAIQGNGCKALSAAIERNGCPTLQRAALRRGGLEAFFHASVERRGVAPFLGAAFLGELLRLGQVGAEVV